MARALNNLSVSKIKANLLNVAQSSLYRMTIPIPSDVRGTLNLSDGDFENINLLCCEATLPGSSLTTHEVNNDYHGMTEKMAYRRLYDETIGLTFYVDRNYKVIEMLEGWLDYITGIDNKGTYKNPYVSYRMAYPSSYKANMFLTKFEKDHFTRDFSNTRGSTTTSRTVLDYTFVNAFPLSLTAIPVSYDGSEVLKCSASFNFIRYVMEKSTSPVGSSLNVGSSLVNTGLGIGANDLAGTTANIG